ncbi:hypothetical protein ATANTOWER_003030 [Ataeniobius toweri]|uniref:Uncharacterized protein n=1 Tax=Ataeniobius toweri TaxID=208326 RepID=A0ABU7B1X8_9TELE|nr:hypothetical protein [Ataeniobius toweri]
MGERGKERKHGLVKNKKGKCEKPREEKRKKNHNEKVKKKKKREQSCEKRSRRAHQKFTLITSLMLPIYFQPHHIAAFGFWSLFAIFPVQFPPANVPIYSVT